MVEVFDSVYQGTGAVHEPGTIWAGRQLTRAQRDHLALAALPLTVSVEVDGLGPVLFCHATARDDEEIVLVNSPLAWFGDAFVGVEERMVVCGHTHMPFDRLADGRRVVNPGSVGMPYGPPGTLAYWALLGPDAILRRTAYDLERAAAVLRQHLPGNREFIEENLLNGPRVTPRRSRSSPVGPGSDADSESSPADPHQASIGLNRIPARLLLLLAAHRRRTDRRRPERAGSDLASPMLQHGLPQERSFDRS